MSTLYCSFPDSKQAQRVATVILESGIPIDDISLLAHESYGASHGATIGSAQIATLTDATDFVGASDDPEDGPSVEMERPRLPEDFFAESPVGGGISTARPDDSIASLDESDDSQDLADDESYAHPTQGVHEESDLQRALVTGFPTDIPRIDDFHPGHEPSENLDKSLESLFVPGFGVVMGGGELATAALGVTSNGDLSPIRDHLKDQGVKKRTAEELIDAFMSGSTVLAVALSKGMAEANALEELAEKGGAKIVETISAPRF